MEKTKQIEKNDKFLILKKKLQTFGFNEPFKKENYDLISHIISDFEKILFSSKSISNEKNALESKNRILENEIETLKQQINSLLDKNIIDKKIETKLKFHNEDKKNFLSEINKLKEEISDMKKDKHLLELTIEKNKSSIEFLKIENQNYLDKENTYKEKISELLKINNDIKDEKQKYFEIYQNSDKIIDELKQKVKSLEEKNENLENNLKKVSLEGGDMSKLLKEKNKALRDGEENNYLLRKDLEIINDKLKEVISENDSIKKINNDLFKDKSELEKELKELKIKMEELKINKTNIENENKLINAEKENIKYKNLINEKKLYANNCEIQEMDKTIKYLKKKIEQIKMMNNININSPNLSNMYCKTVCSQCGCRKNTNNFQTIAFCGQCGCETNINNNLIYFNGKEYDIQILIEDNKSLYDKNKELKSKLNNMALNLDLYINENNLAADRIYKLENYIKSK